AERLPTGDAEALALDAGLKKARGVIHSERFDFKDAQEFFASPLIETSFLDDWLAFLPDQKTRAQVVEQLSKIIDRERQGAGFEVTVKATVIVGQK
ncbi:MAG: hypothetical protein ACRD82_06860, partial [Blastocatellia bacterium]